MIDLRSDTVTHPTPGMLQAMMEARVGDDVFGDDPSINALEAFAATRLGKEAALFVPSGTMANQIAIRLHTQPGDEVLVEAGAHPFNYEAGGAAMLSGVTIRTLTGESGVLDPDQVSASFRPVDPHFAPLQLVCAEDTNNRGGGTVYPLEVLDAVARVAHEGGASTHLDGARLFNAEVASGVPAARRARDYDTVSVCLSKGLGAPVGSLLCGPAHRMEHARRIRKALGGGMRQAGFLAAAGLYALEHHVNRLATDHTNASVLAEGLLAAGYQTAMPPTNMVYVEVRDAPQVQRDLEAREVACLAVGPSTLRMVTHLDVDESGIGRTLEAFRTLA
ncbi:MAG: low-specificity L-threonine aldolase [Myxococcota bacterium]|nr:low-specificity L-threonine aldolase [Myxococcota bacterium]